MANYIMAAFGYKLCDNEVYRSETLSDAKKWLEKKGIDERIREAYIAKVVYKLVPQ
jgi:hypothetical protein